MASGITQVGSESLNELLKDIVNAGESYAAYYEELEKKINEVEMGGDLFDDLLSKFQSNKNFLDEVAETLDNAAKYIKTKEGALEDTINRAKNYGN